MRFDERQLATIRGHLLGEGSDLLIRYMQAHGLGQSAAGFSEEPAATARALGWIDEQGVPTELGFCAADSCREYQFWLERDRALPFEGAAPDLTTHGLKDREVLEIGSGAGMNLMSLMVAGGKAKGAEPIEAYVQIGGILCEREGLAPPEVQIAAAEALPYADGSADVVLCISAHYFFDIPVALAEVARVLRPGGELIIIGGTFGSYLWGTLRKLPRRPAEAKGMAITMVNTFGVVAWNRRIFSARSGFSTTRPVYPTQAMMRAMLRRAGLKEISPMIRVGTETCFRARRG